VDFPDLRRPDELPLGVVLLDDVPLGDLARADPLAGDGVAVSEWEEEQKTRHAERR